MTNDKRQTPAPKVSGDNEDEDILSRVDTEEREDTPRKGGYPKPKKED